MASGPPPPPPDPARPVRWRVDPQPEPVEYASRHPSQRWMAVPLVGSRGTGKAAAYTMEQRLTPVCAPTLEAAIEKREAAIETFVNKRQQRAPSTSAAASVPPREPQPRRILPSRRRNRLHPTPPFCFQVCFDHEIVRELSFPVPARLPPQRVIASAS